MARKGREFEKLVAHLETILAGTGIEIHSPDRILDIHTGEPREIDISLRAKVGTHDILIILECRERKAKQDLRWIEELANKRDSVKASRVVAVCSQGFSKGAKNKAKFLNVELRSIDNLLIDDIQNWCRMTQVVVSKRCHKVVHIELHDESLQLLFTNMRSDIPIFRDAQNNTMSIDDLSFKVVDQNPTLFSDIWPNDEPKLIEAKIELVEPLSLELGTVHTKVEKLNLLLQVWIEIVYVDASRIVQYSSGDGKTITQAITFEVDINGKKLNVTASNAPGQGTKVTTHFDTDQ